MRIKESLHHNSGKGILNTPVKESLHHNYHYYYRHLPPRHQAAEPPGERPRERAEALRNRLAGNIYLSLSLSLYIYIYIYIFSSLSIHIYIYIYISCMCIYIYIYIYMIIIHIHLVT